MRPNISRYIILIWIITLLTPLFLFGQDKDLADSLIKLYESENYTGNKIYLLKEIAEEVSNPELQLHYSNKLIETAARDSLFEFLHSGYLQKGNALRESGNLDDSIESFFLSIHFAKIINYKAGEGAANISIADIYSEIGNSNNAKLYYERGIEILRQTSDSLTLASALLNAGDEALNSENYDKALNYFEESGQVFSEIDYLIGTAYNLGNVGMVHAQQGNDSLAEKNINKAITILEDLKDFYPISVYLTYMSDIYLRKNDFPTAVRYAERSLDLAKSYGLKEQLSDANLQLSELYQERGDAAKSYHYYKDHIAYRDSVKNIEVVQQMADQRTEFEVGQKQVEVDLLNEQKRTQRIIAIATAIALLLILVLAIGLYRRNTFIKKTNEIIAAEKDRSENLLLNILPEQTAQELKEEGKVKAQKFESVSVLFTDFKGFTKFSENLPPEELVERVDFYFSKFDAIMEKHGLEKIKTIGDAYMCAAGLPFPIEDHALRMTRAAKEIVRFVQDSKDDPDNDQAHFDIRVGIHSGPVVAGVVGTKKFSYDIWGDTVNVASRMESNSEPGRINVSENTYQLIKEEFDCSFRGEIEAKNRGSLKMYFVEASRFNG